MQIRRGNTVVRGTRTTHRASREKVEGGRNGRLEEIDGRLGAGKISRDLVFWSHGSHGVFCSEAKKPSSLASVGRVKGPVAGASARLRLGLASIRTF